MGHCLLWLTLYSNVNSGRVVGSVTNHPAGYLRYPGIPLVSATLFKISLISLPKEAIAKKQMNQTIVTKGKLLGIGLKKNTKIRKGNSALGYFDLNGKTIIPYNLKHYLRITTSVSPSRGGYPYGIKATPSLGASYGALESKEVSKNTSNAKRSEPKVSLNVCNNLRFKLEERLQFLRTECTKGSEAFEGGQLGGYTTRPEGSAPYGAPKEAFQLPRDLNDRSPELP